MEKMSLDDKISMIGGHNNFYIKGFPKYGIPAIYMSDATSGVHIRPEINSDLKKSVSFPAPIALAATWNPTLSESMAKAIGEECRAGGISILLGPGINIHRISQCGRNFEYFGEDPYLSARITENYVKGMQSTGTMSVIKHFLCNNNEHHRRLSNAIVSPRALNEIYLPAFKAGIDAGAMGVMTSYNLVNGEYAAENREMVTDVLRNQLGFDGLVMSDWRSVYNPEKAIRSGLDLEMPGDYADWLQQLGENPFRHLKHEAKKYIEKGLITETDIDRMVRSIISTSIRMGFYDREHSAVVAPDFAEHEKTALEVGRESIVLLKNRNNLLPLTPDKLTGKRVLLAGVFADTIPSGGGSSYVEGYNNVLMKDALTDAIGSALTFKKHPTDDDFRAADYVILSVGTYDREGIDRPFAMVDSLENLTKRAVSLNKNTVVVLSSGGSMRMTDWANDASAILYAWFPGQSGNTALAEIITGKISPSGKLPFTVEREFTDSPGADYKDPAEPLEMPWQDEYSFRFPMNNIEYKEGVLVGYRWYETKNIKPMFAFGHGLSYTNFDYSSLKAPKDFGHGDNVDIEFCIRNTGDFEGKEIAQVYIEDVKSSVIRPVKELKAFQKVSLKPGESQTVKISLKPENFMFYDEVSSSWIAEPGKFVIHVGSASDDIRLKKTITLK